MTRYLCAAAHLDSAFADAAIGEYLVERTRAIPPSPGVDTAAVLRDAVAARYRRRVRDGIVVVLTLLFALLCFPLFVLWVVLAAGVLAAGKVFGAAVRTALAVSAALIGIMALYGMWTWLQLWSASTFYAMGLEPDLDTGPVLGVLVGIVLVAIIVADEFAVYEVTRRHFRSRNFVSDARAHGAGWMRTFRTVGHAAYVNELERVAAAQRRAESATGMAEIIVHRDRVPFNGAGVMVRDEVLAIPLRPDDSDELPIPFRPSDLHRHVTGVVAELRQPASLSPWGRLRRLWIGEQVYLPAEQLLRDSGTSMRPTVLPDLSAPPIGHLPPERARNLADVPEEAARYYQCYRVESWDRDLSVSCHFTAGTDLRTLYLEWTHCVLTPIKSAYRAIDRPDPSGPSRRALESLVVLPLSIPVRFVTAIRRIRPIKDWPGEVVPDRYGAGPTLREHASDANVHYFFQDADAVRYVKVIEQALFRGVESFLEAHNYSTEDLLETARTKISNSITIEDGTFVNSPISNRDVKQKNRESGSDRRPTESSGAKK